MEDIGLDSIALAEVMVLLVENDQPPPDLEEFEERAWEGVRLIDLIGDQDGVD